MTTFNGVAHVFASAAHDVKVGLEAVGKFSAKIAADTKLQSEVEGATLAFTGSVQAVDVERIAFSALGALASLLATADQAQQAKLSDAGLDASVVAQVKALLPTIQAQLSASGIKL